MSVRRRVSTRVREPSIAAGIVAAVAFAFTSLYLLRFTIGKPDPPVRSAVVLNAIIVVNAYLVTYVVWSLAVSDAPSISQRRLGAVGAVIGLVSHLTLGLLLGAVSALRDDGALADGIPTVGDAVGWAFVSLFIGFYSLVFTAGIPVLLSAAVGAYLGKLHEERRGE
ncbi:hypothetical protein ACFQDG_16930 [Natronoarchaeum mannanilyticum]|uniref:Uncharacterized protein n=1 Tax=Natronoarchaeum mannanilyticum TaxID=926360 RepID=A0AAV3T678_9EURY